MDLGLLVIANSIMRTRLPPNKKKGDSASIVNEILADVAYILYMVGSFLVGLKFRSFAEYPDNVPVRQIFWGLFIPCEWSQFLFFDNTHLH